MNKQAYLNAMGITRWAVRRPKLPVFTVLIDDDNAIDKISEHPIFLSVLEFIGHRVDACEFKATEEKEDKIIWDLRRPKPEHALLRRVNRKSANKQDHLVSKPLGELEHSVEDKKALWQQISALYSEQVLQFGEQMVLEGDSEAANITGHISGHISDHISGLPHDDK
ncbi:hypothetical protein [uncultured Shewanella sp.]|uniref:hypothetical protein n=1 Tax=uncultured Shewanella sp. TaxID=173975 RepID=UPI002611F866|nr:hypothetical protein [uncultured Shewanella sp.]